MSRSTTPGAVRAGAVADASSDASPTVPARTPRRGDIEGLRIVAVALVAVYHYTQAGVSGGVDVFLFLSGYLVLGGLARRLGRAEAPRLGDFYRRTVRRLLPMSWAVAAVTMLGALLVADQGDLVGLGQQFLASLLYVENAWLADHQVAYGSSSTYLDPFQHFWSLSVQLQVFLVAPAVLVLVVRGAARLRRPAQPVLAPVGLLCLAAVATGWWLADRDQALAYFSTLARTWEFLLGAVLAVVAPHVRLPQAVRTVVGWAGLVALAVTGLFVDGAQKFPGPWALLPLLAAATIVLAGAQPTRFGVDRVLSWRPLANSGRYAYGLYLWHWPVMSLWLLGTDHPRLDLRGALVVSLLACALTVASHHAVEAPLRRPLRDWSVPSRWLAAGLTALLAGTGVVATAAYREDVRWTSEVTALADAADLSTHPGAMSVYMPEDYRAPDGMLIVPVPQEGPLDESVADTSCDVVGHEPGMWCLWDQEADFGGGADVVLLGGSHSAAWLAPLQQVGSSFSWRITSYIRGGCPFVLTDVLEVADYYDPDWTAGCNAWNAKLWRELQADPPDLVVTTFSRPFGPHGEPEWVPDEYLEVWNELDRLGVRVLALRANAQLPTADAVCGDGADRCDFARAAIYGDDDEIVGTPVPDGLRLLDLTQLACADAVCPSVIGNVRVYADQTHLTNSYALSAWPVLYDFVVGAFPDLAQPG